MGGFIVQLLIQHENRIFFCVVLHCHVWPVRLYHIFSNYLIKDTILEKKKKLLNIKCIFSFSLQILSEKSVILRIFQ